MKSRSDDLHFLLSVVDSGSFSGAAEQLEVSVTRVSRAVTRLEASLNTTLLNRTTRKVALTEEGHLFVEKVRGGLAALEEAEEQLAIRKQRPAGRLRVDAANPFLLHQIVPHVREFRAAYPDIELELTASDQIVDLLLENLKAIRPTLNEKELSILDDRLLSEDPVTLREIGERFDVTRERVRQIEARLIAKIREHMTEKIKDFSKDWVLEHE